MNFEKIKIDEYDYSLPEDRIALYPLQVRGESKLLLLRNDDVSEDIFLNVDRYMNEGSLLVLNNTKVIHARLLFRKETGSAIEIFCLEPVLPSADHALAFSSTSGVTMKCLIGNNKKWKQGKLKIQHKNIVLQAEKIRQEDDSFLVKFEWTPPEISFAEIIDLIGKIPLPPYIKREAEELDHTRYQTVYALEQGSVAAPTAGLHFSEEVLHKLSEKKIKKSFITLHVGAGTFKPVTSSHISNHMMHTEVFSVTTETIQNLLEHENKILAVGTTTVRTLESLYWSGKKLIKNSENPFHIEQWLPYKLTTDDLSMRDSLSALCEYCKKNKMDHIIGNTCLMIVPGYKFRVVNEMITNFHQPKSTLLLLVSAFIRPQWKEVYQYALDHDFRFLSYGDVCYFKPAIKN